MRGEVLQQECKSPVPESDLPSHVASCDMGLDLQESGQALEVCSTEASRKPSQITSCPAVLPNASPACWGTPFSGKVLSRTPSVGPRGHYT